MSLNSLVNLCTKLYLIFGLLPFKLDAKTLKIYHNFPIYNIIIAIIFNGISIYAFKDELGFKKDLPNSGHHFEIFISYLTTTSSIIIIIVKNGKFTKMYQNLQNVTHFVWKLRKYSKPKCDRKLLIQLVYHFLLDELLAMCYLFFRVLTWPDPNLPYYYIRIVCIIYRQLIVLSTYGIILALSYYFRLLNNKIKSDLARIDTLMLKPTVTELM